MVINLLLLPAEHMLSSHQRWNNCLVHGWAGSPARVLMCRSHLVTVMDCQDVVRLLRPRPELWQELFLCLQFYRKLCRSRFNNFQVLILNAKLCQVLKRSSDSKSMCDVLLNIQTIKTSAKNYLGFLWFFWEVSLEEVDSSRKHYVFISRIQTGKHVKWVKVSHTDYLRGSWEILNAAADTWEMSIVNIAFDTKQGSK